MSKRSVDEIKPPATKAPRIALLVHRCAKECKHERETSSSAAAPAATSQSPTAAADGDDAPVSAYAAPHRRGIFHIQLKHIEKESDENIHSAIVTNHETDTLLAGTTETLDSDALAGSWIALARNNSNFVDLAFCEAMAYHEYRGSVGKAPPRYTNALFMMHDEPVVGCVVNEYNEKGGGISLLFTDIYGNEVFELRTEKPDTAHVALRDFVADYFHIVRDAEDYVPLPLAKASKK